MNSGKSEAFVPSNCGFHCVSEQIPRSPQLSEMQTGSKTMRNQQFSKFLAMISLMYRQPAEKNCRHVLILGQAF